MLAPEIDVQSYRRVITIPGAVVGESETLQVGIGQLRNGAFQLGRIADVRQQFPDDRIDRSGLVIPPGQVQQVHCPCLTADHVLEYAALRIGIENRPLSGDLGWLPEFLVVDEEESLVVSVKPE